MLVSTESFLIVSPFLIASPDYLCKWKSVSTEKCTLESFFIYHLLLRVPTVYTFKCLVIAQVSVSNLLFQTHAGCHRWGSRPKCANFPPDFGLHSLLLQQPLLGLQDCGGLLCHQPRCSRTHVQFVRKIHFSSHLRRAFAFKPNAILHRWVFYF